MPTTTQSVITPEFVLGYREMIVATLAVEMKTNRKVIAAIPEERKDYKPDPKARSAHQLAWHIAYDDVTFLNKISDMKIEMTAPAPEPATIAAILKWYDEQFPKAIQRVMALTAEQLATPVDFFGFMRAPLFQYLILVNNHSIHHRGQLATYLRPMGSKVPNIYGDSADQPFQG
jgi:uncharacterized damage-inducible protein DinB